MAMRYDIQLPEFSRVTWVSQSARDYWEPIIRGINEIWPIVERESVAHNIRSAALQVVSPYDLPELSQWATDHELVVSVLNRQGSTQSYQSGSLPYVEGQPWVYRVAITRAWIAHEFARAWKDQDNEKVGQLLGYPECCRRFFAQHWVDEGWLDTTYPMVGAVDEHHRVTGPRECNILLRWLGVRATPHLPCSFDCSHSRQFAARLIGLGRALGYKEQIDGMGQILEWPVRWSSLHGVAIITTPVLKIVASTDALSERVIIDREGSVYPQEGARGVEFPFQNTQPIQLKKEDDWSDNGFTSWFAMRQAHQMILSVAPAQWSRVLDLGCGNGYLLQRIGCSHPCGVEGNLQRFEKAVKRLGDSAELSHCNIYDFTPTGIYDVTLLACNRLDEDPVKGTILLDKLSRHTRYLVLYSYGNSDGNSVMPNSSYRSISSIREGKMWASLWESQNVVDNVQS